MEDDIPIEKITKLWKSRRTMLQVLTDRGYTIQNDNHLSLEEFIEWVGHSNEDTVREAMTLTYEKPKEKILVIWLKEPKLGTNLRDILNRIKNERVSRGIIIVDQGITPTAMQIIRDLRSRKLYIDTYTLDESTFNIMEHQYVPKHVICSSSEKKKIMNAYAVDSGELPHLKITDPVVRHLGAVRGQLLKITRNSETQTGCENVSYRLVV